MAAPVSFSRGLDLFAYSGPSFGIYQPLRKQNTKPIVASVQSEFQSPQHVLDLWPNLVIQARQHVPNEIIDNGQFLENLVHADGLAFDSEGPLPH
jgi:hypothetical protein